MDTPRDKFALLLTGGGARAAYQVGVLKAIATMLPRNHGIPFPVICGTSAGAINATSLACYASCFHLGVKKLEWVWRNFDTSKIYRTDFRGAYGHILSHVFSGAKAEYALKTPGSLLDNSPLRQLLNQVLDFHRIDRNLVTNHLKALAVTGSSYSTGHSVSFFQAGQEIEPWQRAKREGIRTIINTEHLMASAAIPLVFPPVKIAEQHFGDGSIHQLSPLSPVIHLDAEKVIVIGVDVKNKPTRFSGNPTSASIAGHLLDTIFADTLNADLERLNRVNHTISLLTEKARKQTNLRPLETLLVNPSHSFDDMAMNHYQRMPRSIRWLLKFAGVREGSTSSLVSYLLFEKQYCGELIDLGFKDGMDNKEALKHFLEI